MPLKRRPTLPPVRASLPLIDPDGNLKLTADVALFALAEHHRRQADRTNDPIERDAANDARTRCLREAYERKVAGATDLYVSHLVGIGRLEDAATAAMDAGRTGGEAWRIVGEAIPRGDTVTAHNYVFTREMALRHAVSLGAIDGLLPLARYALESGKPADAVAALRQHRAGLGERVRSADETARAEATELVEAATEQVVALADEFGDTSIATTYLGDLVRDLGAARSEQPESTSLRSALDRLGGQWVDSHIRGAGLGATVNPELQLDGIARACEQAEELGDPDLLVTAARAYAERSPSHLERANELVTKAAALERRPGRAPFAWRAWAEALADTGNTSGPGAPIAYKAAIAAAKSGHAGTIIDVARAMDGSSHGRQLLYQALRLNLPGADRLSNELAASTTMGAMLLVPDDTQTLVEETIEGLSGAPDLLADVLEQAAVTLAAYGEGDDVQARATAYGAHAWQLRVDIAYRTNQAEGMGTALAGAVDGRLSGAAKLDALISRAARERNTPLLESVISTLSDRRQSLIEVSRTASGDDIDLEHAAEDERRLAEIERIDETLDAAIMTAGYAAPDDPKVVERWLDSAQARGDDTVVAAAWGTIARSPRGWARSPKLVADAVRLGMLEPTEAQHAWARIAERPTDDAVKRWADALDASGAPEPMPDRRAQQHAMSLAKRRGTTVDALVPSPDVDRTLEILPTPSAVPRAAADVDDLDEPVVDQRRWWHLQPDTEPLERGLETSLRSPGDTDLEF